MQAKQFMKPRETFFAHNFVQKQYFPVEFLFWSDRSQHVAKNNFPQNDQFWGILATFQSLELFFTKLISSMVTSIKWLRPPFCCHKVIISAFFASIKLPADIFSKNGERKTTILYQEYCKSFKHCQSVLTLFCVSQLPRPCPIYRKK